MVSIGPKVHHSSLMIINSISYSTNDLVLFKFQILINISVQCLASSKRLKVKVLIQELKHKEHIKNSRSLAQESSFDRVKGGRSYQEETLVYKDI